MANDNKLQPIAPGGTGNESQSDSNQTTAGGAAPAETDSNISPCTPSQDLPGVIGKDECEVSETPLPDFQSIVTDQADGTMYTSFASEPTYETDYHTIQLPVASDVVTNASFAVVANSTMKRRITWEVEKIGDWPLMPNPFTNNSNEVLLKQTIMGRNIELIGDQFTKMYTIRGEYIYGMVNPQSEVLYMGVPPYVTDSVTDTAIPPANFIAGITSP